MYSTVPISGPLGRLPSPPEREYKSLEARDGTVNSDCEMYDRKALLKSLTETAPRSKKDGYDQKLLHMESELTYADEERRFNTKRHSEERVELVGDKGRTSLGVQLRRITSDGYNSVTNTGQGKNHDMMRKIEMHSTGSECRTTPECSTVNRPCSVGVGVSGPKRMARSAPSTPRGRRQILSITSECVKVVARVRPLLEGEMSRGERECISFACSPGEDEIRVLCKSQPDVRRQDFQQLYIERFFSFCSCIRPGENQSSVFDKSGVDGLLDEALSGTNVTIFAYGQTGSGKTYTMIGREAPTEGGHHLVTDNETHQGIIPRSLHYIFSKTNERSMYEKHVETTFGASYCEIYNENLYDLLQWEESPLQLKWDPGEGYHAPDLHIQPCDTLHDVLAVLSLGSRRRRLRSHSLNAESSRSHAILTLHINTASTHEDETATDCSHSSKIVFVDLAGSERLKDSGFDGVSSMKETANINKSLFMLGKVISALAAGLRGPLVPYRESKLTKILIGSMATPSKCLMIACCSPSDQNVDETLSTLSYAIRAKNIRSIPSFHLNMQAVSIASLKREIKMLRTENALLRKQIHMKACLTYSS